MRVDREDGLFDDDDELPDFLADLEDLDDEDEDPDTPQLPSPLSRDSSFTHTSDFSRAAKKPFGSSSFGSSSKSGKKDYSKKRAYREPVSYRDETPESLGQTKTEKLRRSAMNVCMYQLGQRAMTAKGLRDRMIKKGLPDFIINDTLAELEQMHLIDDRSYAEEFVRVRREYKKRGDRLIAMELSRKGIDRDIIDEVLSPSEDGNEDAPSEFDRALDLARSRVRSSRGIDQQKRFNRLAGLLARNGYGGSVVYEVARQVLEEDKEEEESD